MSQHDFDIANQTASNARVDINLALKALGSLSSGVTAPTTTYANMLWYDTGANILKMRSEADDAWISMGYLDQTANTFRILDDTQVVNTSGTQTGLLGDQSTATWGAGTGTTESLVSPAKVKSAIEALVPAPTPSIGESQTWAVVSRTAGTSYQNTTGRSIQLLVGLLLYNDGGAEGGTNYPTILQVSSNGSTWVSLADSSRVSPVIPSNHYYRYVSGLNNTTGNATFTILS